jgi:hypothetical protein
MKENKLRQLKSFVFCRNENGCFECNLYHKFWKILQNNILPISKNPKRIKKHN